MCETLRPAEAAEVDAVFALLERRVRWTARTGIGQWDAGYLAAYPRDYFASQQARGNLYVLRERGRLAAAVVLLSQDDRWPDGRAVPAFYVHNLMTDPDCRGAGVRLLSKAADLALQTGKTALRLDCAETSGFLNRYYEELGFVLRGRCQDGPYRGNRREKRLSPRE